MPHRLLFRISEQVGFPIRQLRKGVGSTEFQGVHAVVKGFGFQWGKAGSQQNGNEHENTRHGLSLRIGRWARVARGGLFVKKSGTDVHHGLTVGLVDIKRRNLLPSP